MKYYQKSYILIFVNAMTELNLNYGSYRDSAIGESRSRSIKDVSFPSGVPEHIVN